MGGCVKKTMGENQDFEQLLEKLAQLLKAKNEANVILTARGSNEMFKISAEELEKFRQLTKSVENSETRTTIILGNSVNLTQPDKGTSHQAFTSTHGSRSNWILDSGASKHVTGTPSEFTTFNPYPPTHKETIQIADGTSQPVRGVGVVQCTPSITLSSVLYAPSFPVNLVSMSSLVDDIDCRVIADRYSCIIEERKTGRRLGIGVRHKGLWYLDRRETDDVLCTALTAVASDDVAKVILQHCRLGHMSFDTMSKMFPEEMKKVDKGKLVCDACEYGKHTRTSYVSRGLRSTSPFVLIHSDVWTSPVVSISGMKYFVTFIDCYSRMTWIYLMKQKNEVLKCFKDFYAYIQNHFSISIQIIRSDNGTEYVNNEFGNFLSEKGILHQTSCPDTSPQNGVAERKNRHLLEVARSLMLTMNVPKFLWSEAVMTGTYLINRMPSRVLGMKTPYEMLFGKNEFIVPPKVFGCTCFVRDHRPSVGKLDPRAVKCIFIGYSSGQKGYKCWSPNERRTFVSMDVTFRESEPFYGELTDLSSLFDFDSSSMSDASREGESEVSRTKEEDEQPRVVVDSVPCSMGKEGWRKPNEEENLKVYTRRQSQHEQQGVPATGETQVQGKQQASADEEENLRWRKPNEEENLRMYTRRQLQQEQQGVPATGETQVQGEQQAPAAVEVASSSNDEPSGTPTPSKIGDSMDLPIALRKGTRVGAGNPPLRYGFEHDIANYVSYTSLSPAYKAFIASLQSTTVPRDWKAAKQDPKWYEAMLEEMKALEKNKTWDLVPLPAGKRPVSCKWVYTVKQNPEGKVERYKARLVARGYSQTYGIDYDETFAPVAKMNTVRILISCATNFGWPLHQLDVKNAFLHGDLQEEVYMEIPPGFSTPRTTGKVCRLRKSLYGLKQSPRAWFDRFRHAVCDMGYRQCNGDHTVFYRHSKCRITILAVYVDDIIITGDDDLEISRLKENLSKEFEVKDLGQLKYFLGIEIARSPKGIVLSQRKYALDLLNDTGMIGCRAASTPIDQNHKLNAQSGEPVDRESYQRLVGRLLYLCHTRPDISYAVSVVSRYMHDPRSGHLDAVYRILRYLKGSPGKGLWFKKNGHLSIDGYNDADWASCLDDRRSTSGYCVFVGGNLVSWRSKKQPVVSRSTAEAEYRAMSLGLSEMLWVRNLLSELKVLRKGPLKVSSSQPSENAGQFKICRCGEGEPNFQTSETGDSPPTACPNCQVLKSGHLLLSSKGIGWTTWKKRWFILTRASLVFFRSDPNAPPRGNEPVVTLGGIDLNNSGSVVVKEDRKLLTVLFPDGRDGRTFTLKAETTEELNEWRSALENALAQAPSVVNTAGQNPIFSTDVTETAEAPIEQSEDKSSVIGRPAQFALVDADGTPSFLEKALRFIEDYGVKVEGILRQSADVEEVKRRFWDYEKGKNEFSPEEDAHVIGDCIKCILREMPASPIPAACCTALVGAYRTDKTRRLDAMNKVIYEVFPEPNRQLLQRILKMMQIVGSHKAVNRMSQSALAACMAPLLLRPLLLGECEIDNDFSMAGDGSFQLLQAAAAANHAQAIVIIMLEEYDQIFDDLEEGSCSSDAYTESDDGDVDKEYSTDNDNHDEDGSYDSGEDDIEEDLDDNTEHSSGGSQCDSKSRIDANDKVVQPPTKAARLEHGVSRKDIDQISSVPQVENSRMESKNPSHPKQESCESNASTDHTAKSNSRSLSPREKFMEKSTNRSKRTLWGRTSARKDLSTEEIECCSDDEALIEKLENNKADLQSKISKEVKENTTLQASLEKRKGALHERRLALEKEVENLRDQLQKERSLRASLESGLMNMRRGQVSFPSTIDSKIKADLEEVATAEADILNLKQKASDLRGQLNNEVQLSSTSLCESCNKRLLNTDNLVEDKQNAALSPGISSSIAASSVGPNSVSHMLSTTGMADIVEQLRRQAAQRSPSIGVTSNEQPGTIGHRARTPLANRLQGSNAYSSTRTEESGVAAPSALAKLTNRLNFLKERRALLASEMQNLDLARPSGLPTAPSPNKDST